MKKIKKIITQLKLAYRLSKYLRVTEDGVYIEYKPNCFYKTSVL